MHHDLNRLRVFFLVYSHSSVSVAARELNLSQPAVSQHLQKLEKELKVQLFTRIHKKLVPTAAGSQLYSTLEPFLSGLPGILEGLRHPADSPYGLVRIGAPYEFGRAYLPDICHSFRQLYPYVRFSIRLGEAQALLKLLGQGEIDFAVIDMVLDTIQAMGSGRELYSIEPLIEEELVMISSAEYYHREICGDHSFNTLIEKEFISDEHDDMFLKHWFMHHFRKANVKPDIVLTVESHQACLRCVKLGMGLTTTSSHLVWQGITAGSIIPVTTHTPNAINTISLVELQDKVPTITEKIFRTHIVASMQKDSMRRRFYIRPVNSTTDSEPGR